MKLTIPTGSEINRIEDRRDIKIRIPHTQFWVLGEKTGTKWNIYLINPETNYKEIIKQEFTTEAFARFSSVVLKTPFPYNGKRAQDARIIKRFTNKIYKNYELTRKSRKLQRNS